jgi:hypothetical protein
MSWRPRASGLLRISLPENQGANHKTYAKSYSDRRIRMLPEHFISRARASDRLLLKLLAMLFEPRQPGPEFLSFVWVENASRLGELIGALHQPRQIVHELFEASLF